MDPIQIHGSPTSREFSNTRDRVPDLAGKAMYRADEKVVLSLQERILTWLIDTKNWLYELFLSCLFNKPKESDIPDNSTHSPIVKSPDRSASPRSQEKPSSPKPNEQAASPLPNESPLSPKSPDPVDNNHVSELISPCRVQPITDLSLLKKGEIVAYKKEGSFFSLKIVHVHPSGSILLTEGIIEVKAFITNLYTIGPAQTTIVQPDEIDTSFHENSDYKIGEEVIYEDRKKGKIVQLFENEAQIDTGETIKSYSFRDLHKIIPPMADNTNIVIGSRISSKQVTEYSSLIKHTIGDLVAVPYKYPYYRVVQITLIDLGKVYYKTHRGQSSELLSKVRKVKSDLKISNIELGESISSADILPIDGSKPFTKDEILAYFDGLNYRRVQYIDNKTIYNGADTLTVDEQYLFRFKESPYRFGDQLRSSQVYQNYDDLKPGDFVAKMDERNGFATFSVVKLHVKNSIWDCRYQESKETKSLNGTTAEYLYVIKKDYVEKKTVLKKEQLGHMIDTQHLIFEDVLRKEEIAEGDFIAFINSDPFCYRTGQILKINNDTILLDAGTEKPIEINIKSLFKIKPSEDIWTTSYRSYKIGDVVNQEDINASGFYHPKRGELAVVNNKIVLIECVGTIHTEYTSEKGKITIGEWGRNAIKPLLPKFYAKENNDPYALGKYVYLNKIAHFKNVRMRVLLNTFSHLILQDSNYNRFKVPLTWIEQ